MATSATLKVLQEVVTCVWRQLWRFGLAALIALLVPVSFALAQSPATPVQLKDDQLNQIVRAVTSAVLADLKTAPAQAPAAPPPATTSTATSAEGIAHYLEQKQLEFLGQLGTTLRAFPALADQVRSIIERVDGGVRGLSTLEFLGVMAAILAGAAAAGYAVAAVARRLLPGTEPKAGPATVGQTIRRAVASLAGLAAFWVATSLASSQFAHGMGMQGTVAHWMLVGGRNFALYYTLILILFRPSEPAYRIVPLDRDDAKRAMRMFLIVTGVVVLRSWINVLIAAHQPGTVISAGLLINNLLFVSSFFLAAYPARGAVRRWLESTAMGTRVSPMRTWLAANWLVVAGTAVLMVSALHAYGAVMGHASVVTSLTRTVNAVVTMIFVCAVVEFMGRRIDRADQASKRAIPKLPGLVSKMLRVFILLGATIYFIRLWAVDALQVMGEEKWSEFADFLIAPLAAMFVGYLAVSYVNYFSARYLATHPVTATAVNENGDVIPKPDGSSRLRTLIPIIRITTIVMIVTMMALLVLSELGFNITPLLAGASVIGLAISFGSQTLVKDIVTGVLFLAEDSFRIGEYIVCGTSSGTVEGFTLRSVRLRHQDGQIFTVPFGQIGEIVNFSRDWSTVNFSMSLDRDIDLDDVRAATRKVAAELKDEFKDRLLDPLQVQGVKDVTDNALVVLFKFTALPLNPAEIERTARIRLLKAFKDDGIGLSRRSWAGAAAAAATTG